MGRGMFSRACSLFLLILILVVFTSEAFSAIVLDYDKSKFKFHLLCLDPDDCRGLSVPMCDLSVQTAQGGRGMVHVTHTPLYDGMQTIPYELYYGSGREVRCLDDWGIPFGEPVTCVWAELEQPFGNDPAGYSSDITVLLVPEL